MRVIVTGSRDYADRVTLWRVLDDLWVIDNRLVVVHGACPTGADDLADDWALARARGPEEWANVRVHRFPPNYRLYGSPAALHIRNADMVKAGGDLMTAFFAPPPALNQGTSRTVKLARAAGIPVREYGRETRTTPAHRQETLL
jgi:hypothetical protein